MKKKIIIGIVLGVIFVLIGYIIISNKDIDRKLLGSWISEGDTIYEFKKDHTGIMILPLSEYDFTYKIDNGKLTIDYDNEKANDMEYEYLIKEDKLILKSVRGEFSFKRNK